MRSDLTRSFAAVREAVALAGPELPDPAPALRALDDAEARFLKRIRDEGTDDITAGRGRKTLGGTSKSTSASVWSYHWLPGT